RFDSGYIAGDITLPETQAKLFAEIRRWNTEIDVVIATPPCQGMSVANHKKIMKWQEILWSWNQSKSFGKFSPSFLFLKTSKPF
ncbi:DNA cytosine methyltransferase, partial [Neisseria meningitidis]|uniref:DNA cytosine methyltransferase n=1 Tax=Neisseria meningitidis TaxID=487 RepID=UPI0021F0BEEF